MGGPLNYHPNKSGFLGGVLLHLIVVFMFLSQLLCILLLPFDLTTLGLRS